MNSVIEETKIGWLGTGVMGAAMARRFLEAGFSLYLYSRTRNKASELEKDGAIWMSSPAAVARNAEVVFSIVGYPRDVETVILGEDGVVHGIKSGAILVEMTTSSPELAKQIEYALECKSAHSLDAPVSGGDLGARSGSLAIMCGGKRSAYRQVLPLLEIIGKEINWFGPSGFGQKVKMSNQILIASTMVGTVEALLYAERSGINLDELVNLLSKGAAGCWSLKNLAPRMIRNDWEPGFYVKHFIKDMGIALEDSARMNLKLKGLELAHEFYRRAEDEGLSEKGTQALYKVLSSMNNSAKKP